MSKFKVGDRVRVVSGPHILNENQKEGKIVSRLGFNGRKGWDVRIDNYPHSLFFRGDDLVPVAAAKSTFKVGDKVRYSGKPHHGACTDVDVMTIDSIGGGDHGDNVRLRYPRGFSQVARLVDIVPATLRVEEGKFYKTRDGRKVGPMERYAWQDKNDENAFVVVHGDGKIWGVDGKGGNAASRDLIAEWVDEPVAAQPAEKQKFKVGDRVRFKDSYGASEYRGLLATVISVPPASWGIQVDAGGSRGVSTEREDSLELVEQAKSFLDGLIGHTFTAKVAKSATPAIVCLIENGQPLPSTRPHVHTNRGSAEDEAARLAKKHPGSEFGVYELVAIRKEAKVYDFAWQRLAAEGRKIEAIKELRNASGLYLKHAKDAVESFLQAA